MTLDINIDAAQLVYEDFSVIHTNQSNALNRAKFLISMCPSVSFVIIKGPSGVGKTHLLKSLESFVSDRYSSLVEKEPSAMPCISTFAAADGAKKFDWGRFWTDALEALHDPFVHARPERGPDIGDFPRMYSKESLGTSALRKLVERELKLRKTKVWIVDEAQHMLLGGTAGEPGDQFDVLKSVSQTTGVKIVLCGTYQLASLLTYSSQVMRRSATVELKRYDFTSKKDLRTFASVAKTLLQSIPVASFPDVKTHCKELYLGTLGCIGVLKDWIAQAWALSAFEGKLHLTIEHLRETRLSDKALNQMTQDILAGEFQGFTKLESRYDKSVMQEARSSCRTMTPGPRRNPGTRNPARDPVGKQLAGLC